MHEAAAYYNVAIVGGGLAGLSLAIRLAKQGVSTAVFEKEVYPFHKVCGEYISLESWDDLQGLGISLDLLQLPKMDLLELSAPNGNRLRQSLPLGGFGLSRYVIDQKMMELARNTGVTVYEGTKVQSIEFDDDRFTIRTGQTAVEARVCCSAAGKRSNIDVKWGRPFIRGKQNTLNNLVGVKYHVRLDHPRNTIALHNFPGGYCGIAAIEEDKVNLCYLTSAINLRQHGNDLKKMEENVLFSNPHLKKAFTKADFLFSQPLTISQISFERKEQVYQHVLLLGDAAGMITPLCGNGMSMALQSSRIATQAILRFLRGSVDRTSMERLYEREWQRSFSSRLRAGRAIQELFQHRRMTNGIIAMLKPFPLLARAIIRRTHG